MCLADGAIAVGHMTTLSDSETGTVQPMGGGGSGVGDLITEPYIGDALYAGDDNGGVGVNLKLFP